VLKNKKMIKYKINVEVKSDLPDFRLFKVFIWGENHNIDSDGDSFNPASRSWTDLYMSSREIVDESFSVSRLEDTPSIYEVSSSNILIANRVGYFLAKETSHCIFIDNLKYDYSFLQNKLGNDFNLDEAIKRSNLSVWRNSNLENPYPNLQ